MRARQLGAQVFPSRVWRRSAGGMFVPSGGGNPAVWFDHDFSAFTGSDEAALSGEAVEGADGWSPGNWSVSGGYGLTLDTNDGDGLYSATNAYNGGNRAGDLPSNPLDADFYGWFTAIDVGPYTNERYRGFLFNRDDATGAYMIVGCQTSVGKPSAWYEAGTTGDADMNWIVAAPGGSFTPTSVYTCEVWWDSATSTFTSTVSQGADSATHSSITLDATMLTNLGVDSNVGIGYQRGDWDDSHVMRRATIGTEVAEL